MMPKFRGSRRLKPFLFGVTLFGALGAMAALAANGSVAYTYDPLGRVSTASYDTGVCIAYTYDPSGNRTSQTITVGTGSPPVWGAPTTWGCFNW